MLIRRLIQALVAVLTFLFCSLDLPLVASDAPISDNLIRRILPDLAEPRIMNLKDLRSEDERIAFRDYAYSFWIRGDFDGDNVPDVALAGHFKNLQNSEDQAFVLIVSRRKDRWTKTFFLRARAPVVVLKLIPYDEHKKTAKRLPAVAAQFTGMPSDDYALIYWDGKSYRVVSGFDTREWKEYSQ